MNEIVADEKDINNEIFLDYFKYQNPSFLVKDLISANQNKHEKLVSNINNRLIDLRNYINRKENPENENPKKVANIVEKIVDFNKQQKGKGLPSDLAHATREAKVSDYKHIKILTPKQTLQRLPTALALVKAGNGSENILNEIRQVIYSLYRAKEITKTVYNNITNSIKL